MSFHYLKSGTVKKLSFILFLLVLTFSNNLFAQTLKEVLIKGNVKIGKEAIQSMIELKAGSTLTPQAVSRDIKSIFASGYFEDVSANYEKVKEVLAYTVKEKLTIRTMLLVGNKKIDKDDLLKEIETKQYGYLNYNILKKDIENLRKLYDSKGFFLANIEYEVKELKNNDVELIIRIKEDAKVKIKRINFLGNTVYKDSELKKVMMTKEGGFLSFLTGSGTFKEEMFEQDREILQQFYGKKGYINAKISPPRLYLSTDMASLYLNINIEEGEEFFVGKVSAEGDLIKPKEEIENMIKISEGEIADSIKIRQDVQTLTNLYADDGYAYANVIPRPIPGSGKNVVDLAFDIQKGDKVYIEAINIKGNTDTRDKVVRRELQLKEGDLYSYTKIKESKENLERLGYFEEVRISTPVGSSQNQMMLNIEIKEKSTGAFQVGAGFNSLENFQFIAQLQKRNLFGRGYDVALQANIGGKTKRFNLYWVDYWFMDSSIGLRLNAYNEEWRFVDFDLQRVGGSIGFDFPLYKKGLHRINLSTKYLIEKLNYSNLSETVSNLFDDGTLSSFTVTLARDTRNRIFEPSQGSLISADATIAGGFLGGSNSFAKFTGNYKKFFLMSKSRMPFIGGAVLQFNYEMGYIIPLFEDEIPIYQKYFPGGIYSIRGFELRSLGPSIPVATSSDPSSFTTEDFALGGNKQIIFNVEYVFPLFTAAGLKWVFFYDMGNAFDKGEHFSLLKLRKSLGFGIRWVSPIGPLRFEWGFPLDKKEGENSVVFDFTIGSLF